MKREIADFDDEYALFSLIHALFNSDYHFSRPLIYAENKKIIMSKFDAYVSYALALDKVSIENVKSYGRKTNFAGQMNYLLFMDYLSDNFVQIKKDEMVSKKVFSISDDKLKNIYEKLDLLFINKDNIDLNAFDGYQLLPSLDYPWNKYLLAGIIRTYLSNSYEIINTSTSYLNNDFIVKKMVK